LVGHYQYYGLSGNIKGLQPDITSFIGYNITYL
jgi:hypothetical protein